MRVLGRIGFALLAVFTFWFAIDYARGAMTIRYFENEGQTAVTENDDVFFYGSARDYNQRGALFAIEQEGYTVSFYEIADAKIANNTLTIDSYIYIILRSDEELLETYYLKLTNGTEELELEFYPFRTLNIRMALNEELNEFGIASSRIIEGEFNQISLLDQYKNTLFTETFSILETSLILEDELTTYYETYDKLPFTELEDMNIYPKITHDMGSYIHIMYMSVAVYVVVLILAIYIVFFMKKKYLGKRKPSDILLKESHKYKKGD
jgi:hypothetical protein